MRTLPWLSCTFLESSTCIPLFSGSSSLSSPVNNKRHEHGYLFDVLSTIIIAINFSTTIIVLGNTLTYLAGTLVPMNFRKFIACTFK